MIEINDGFTSISAGADPAFPPLSPAAHRPTGARVTVDFCREVALPPGEIVCAYYDFAGNGRLRAVTGIAELTYAEVKWGCPVVFHYRLSHWIGPAELMHFVAGEVPIARPAELADVAPTGDPIPA